MGGEVAHRLRELLDELRGYPGGQGGPLALIDVVVPLRHRRGDSELSFFSITAVIGTPIEVTVDELAIESFTQPTRPRPPPCTSRRHQPAAPRQATTTR